MLSLNQLLRAILIAIGISSTSFAQYREFTNSAGGKVTARVVFKDLTTVTFERPNQKRFSMSITRLSVEDQAYVSEWTEGSEPEPTALRKTSKGVDSDVIDGDVKNRLFKRSKKEIKTRISEIKRRKRPEGVSKEDYEAVTQLNIFRHLSGVPDDVESDVKLNAHAKEAAIACLKNGGLSHGLGSYTDKCNLNMGGDVPSSVRSYMNDGGANNKEQRGHRRWCLNPPMGKTGFGGEDRYSAMWAMDSSGSSSLDFWGYPGEGFYPKEYLLGNSWSAYFNKSVPNAEDINITIFKLSSRPEKMPISTDGLIGKEIKVTYKFAYSNTVNFEVEYSGRKKGLYWVQIKGRGIKQRYLVDLY